ncbi:hypothetical protein F3G64_36940, partial [Pseudomonas aeruginosa]
MVGLSLGININGEYITHLRFADDNVIMAETMENLSTMLKDLSRASIRVGLNMNKEKTKIMLNAHVAPTPVKIGSSTLEAIAIQLGKSNFEKEVNSQIQIGW